MRDIRDDLRERLETIAAEKRRLQDQVTSLDRQEASVKVLLADEDNRWSGVQPKLFLPTRGGNGRIQHAAAPELTGTPLSQMIREILSDGVGRTARGIGEIVKQRGFPFGEKHPSRVVHFALLGMDQNKLVQSRKGVWTLAKS